MTTIRKYSLFVLDKEKDMPDARLRYRVKWNGNTVAFNVGYRVDVDKWSCDTQRCKNNTTHGRKKTPASVINREINRYEEAIEQVFTNFEKERKVPTADEVRTLFNTFIGRQTEAKYDNLYDLFGKFEQTQGFQNNWTRSTMQKFRTLENHLKDYNPKLSFDRLTDDSLNLFIRHLIDNGIANVTISKYISLMRWFLRWASNNGYYRGNLHNTFRPHLKGASGVNKEVIYLTWDELMSVYHYDFQEPYLDRTRDVFCFCCFTGIRYSDVAALKKQNVFEDSIRIVTQKTSDALKIELNRYSISILDKYKGYTFADGHVFPVISNQKMNKYLKEVGKMVGLDTLQTIVRFRGSERIEKTFRKYELLTTHCGRRTFIVNALYLGIPSEVIMKWTGHSDYKAMKPYVEIIDDLKAKEMDKFNKI